jgi:cellobiose-specific phosphotransferase system component IIA
MKVANRRAASPAKEAVASRNQEIAKKLWSMENELHELHELNVQLIREEMSGDSFGRAPRASSSDEPSSR